MKQANSTTWTKTVTATLALTMLIGSGTAAIASAHASPSAKHKEDKHDNKGKNDKDTKKDSRQHGNFDFKDVDQQNWKWAYEAIIRLASQGVFSGYEDGSFKPHNSITRIEAMVAAVRLLGLGDEATKPENMNTKLNFKDYDQLKRNYPWATGYVTVALEHDLFSESDNVIQPGKPADRLWATILLVKAMKLDAEAKSKMGVQLPFKDADRIPAGSVGYVATAIDHNLISGYDDKSFRPNSPVTRAELAALLDRVDQTLPADTNAQAITGTIQTVTGTTSLSLKKADQTVVSVPLDTSVFIFRKDVKAPVSALQPGDEVLVRTFQGKAVFIEVTKVADDGTVLTDTGVLSSFSLNAQGQIAYLTLSKTVNGVSQSIIYNVAPAVTISGGTGVLTPNQNIVVHEKNNSISSIQILS